MNPEAGFNPALPSSQHPLPANEATWCQSGRSRALLCNLTFSRLMEVAALRRAMVELERALRENSICREPLFSGLHNPEEVPPLSRSRANMLFELFCQPCLFL